MREENKHLQYISDNVPILANSILDKETLKLNRLMAVIPATVSGRITTANALLGKYSAVIASVAQQIVQREKMRIDNLSDKVNLLSPQNTLNRGYSLTLHNGHAVTDASQLTAGDELVTHFKSGKVISEVK